jgi:hypothetical protein
MGATVGSSSNNKDYDDNSTNDAFCACRDYGMV